MSARFSEEVLLVATWKMDEARRLDRLLLVLVVVRRKLVCTKQHQRRTCSLFAKSNPEACASSTGYVGRAKAPHHVYYHGPH